MSCITMAGGQIKSPPQVALFAVMINWSHCQQNCAVPFTYSGQVLGYAVHKYIGFTF